MAKTNQGTGIKDAAKSETREILALAVQSVGKAFRRIGIAFTEEAVHLDPDLLTEDQLEALKNEPALRITGAKVTVAVTDAKPTTPVVTPIVAPVDDVDGE